MKETYNKYMKLSNLLLPLIGLTSVINVQSSSPLIPITLEQCLVKLGDLAGQRTQDCYCHVANLPLYSLTNGSACEYESEEAIDKTGVCVNKQCIKKCPATQLVDSCPKGLRTGANFGNDYCSWLACKCYDPKKFSEVATLKDGASCSSYAAPGTIGTCWGGQCVVNK